MVTFEVSHFDISGNDNNEEHPLNIYFISVTFEVSQFDISGKDDNDEHPQNIYFISVILSIPINFTSISSILFVSLS